MNRAWRKNRFPKIKKSPYSAGGMDRARHTARKWQIPTWVTREFLSHPSDSSILDFGCGKFGTQVELLRNNGFDASGYDFEYNGPHKVSLGEKKFDTILVSNVLNVWSNPEELEATIDDIKKFATKDTKIIVNYPDSPRYMPLSNAQMQHFLEDQGFTVQVRHNYSSGVIWTGFFQ